MFVEKENAAVLSKNKTILVTWDESNPFPLGQTSVYITIFEKVAQHTVASQGTKQRKDNKL